LVGRLWSQYVAEGRQLFLKERQEHQRPYGAAVCVAAKLVRIAFAMVRDSSHFELAQAFEPTPGNPHGSKSRLALLLLGQAALSFVRLHLRSLIGQVTI
jgi:hypothetical protein